MEKNFLERLQAADERTKRRVIVISSSVIMVAVVFVWFSYFNSIVMPDAAEVVVGSGEKENFSFVVTVRHGIANIFSGTWSALQAAGAAIFKGRSYNIAP